MVDKIASQVATALYGNSDKIGAGAGKAGGAAGGSSFEDMLKMATESAIDTMKGSEVASAKAVTGEADLNDVVQAVSAAEITLQTVVAVRDRMVGALQEILRMPM
ncbi:MAG: flagellar hook-basal body complex protein FliE [Pseudobdellovibrionaceae bacterium]